MSNTANFSTATTKIRSHYGCFATWTILAAFGIPFMLLRYAFFASVTLGLIGILLAALGTKGNRRVLLILGNVVAMAAPAIQALIFVPQILSGA